MARKKRGDVEAAEVPMSSMIDVVFLLLIYFIVTQKDEISEAHLAVNLPSPNQASQTQEKPKLLELHIKPGRIELQGSAYPPEVIKTKLATLAAIDPEMTVIIKTSVMAKTRELVEVLDMCKSVGLSKLNVMTLQ